MVVKAPDQNKIIDFIRLKVFRSFLQTFYLQLGWRFKSDQRPLSPLLELGHSAG